VALIRPESIETAAQRIGEAMGRFRSASRRSDAPLIDHAAWMEELREAFDAALGRVPEADVPGPHLTARAGTLPTGE
jgi:hypothetical protein